MAGALAERLSAVRALRARRSLVEAQARLDLLLLESPDDPRVQAERIFLMIERHEPQARAEAERAVARWGESYGCWLAMAEAAMRAGRPDLDAAAAAAQRAVALWPGGTLGHLTLARVERARGRPVEALAAVRAGVQVDGRDVRLLHLQGELLRELGRTDEAARAVEALPEGPWKERQKLEGSLGRLPQAEAEAELETLAALEPERVEVHERLGTRRYRAGRYAEALASFMTALELAPANPYLRRMAGFAASKAREPARAAALLRPLFVEDPFDERTRTTFVAACRRAGDLAGLRAAIDEALGRHPHARMLHGVRRRYAPDPPAPAPSSTGMP
jgi:predicted Zn-dependent protease